MEPKVSNVFVTTTFTGTSSFSFQIDLLRTATSIKVKTIDFYVDGTVNNIYLLTSDLVGGKTLAYFRETRGSMSPNIDILHNINTYSTNYYTFNVCNIDGSQAVLAAGTLVMHLEFSLM